MQIAVLKERRAGESRVAASPDTVKKFIAAGAKVTIETGAGAGSSFNDIVTRQKGRRVSALAYFPSHRCSPFATSCFS